MKTIYIDTTDFKCRTRNDGTLLAIETSVFDRKCNEFIEGHRFVPFGYSWTRSDGAVFNGQMIAPWKDDGQLDAAQRQYEQALIADMQQALNTLGVNVDG